MFRVVNMNMTRIVVADKPLEHVAAAPDFSHRDSIRSKEATSRNYFLNQKWRFGVLLWWLLCAAVADAKPRDEKPYPAMRRTPARSVVVTNTVHVPLACKFNPVFWLGNFDRPEPPWDYKQNDRLRHFKWYIRNPWHNLDFYVIGIADKTFIREGKYPDRVFAPEGGWNWAVCKYKWLRLPFVSYWRGRFNFYLGWRNRGQFGFEFKFSKPKK